MDHDASRSLSEEDILLDGLPWQVALSLPAAPCKLLLTFYFHQAADTAFRVQTRIIKVDFEQQAVAEAAQKVLQTKMQFTTQVQDYNCHRQDSQSILSADAHCIARTQKRQRVGNGQQALD